MQKLQITSRRRYSRRRRATKRSPTARLLRDECTAVDDGARYVQARCEGDVVELLLRDDVATFRVAAMQRHHAALVR